jgi:hypothetical protein
LLSTSCEYQKCVKVWTYLPFLDVGRSVLGKC